MRVVITAGPFPDEVQGREATEGLRRGWLAQAGHDAVDAVLVSDGGAGFLAAVRAGSGSAAPARPVLVTGPDGRSVPAEVLLVDGPDGRRTAYLEAAQAAGRHLAAETDLADPADLTSRGVGELLAAAIQEGAGRVVLGCGDLASHDGGAGLLDALGAGDDLADVPAVRERLGSTELVLAAAADLPLLGFHGASAALGTDHGVAAAVTQALETRMGRFTERLTAVLPPRRDLLSGTPLRLEREPSAGVGGGVGYALLALGARRVDGARLTLEELGVLPRLPGALVVIGTPAYDWRSVHEGVVAQAARAALEAAAPAVVLARAVEVGRREGMALGVSGAYGARDGEGWADLAARVARTWSPPPRPGG